MWPGAEPTRLLAVTQTAGWRTLLEETFDRSNQSSGMLNVMSVMTS
jgi:hypothetical protein